MTIPKLGLRENIGQFSLLVLVNAFVGAMVGLERTLLPLIAQEKFAIASTVATMSFIAAFGASKALANYLSGKLSNRFGRKKLLVFGWILAIPVPILLWWAPNWSWVIAANLLLGIHQGFAWSSTVVMKIDLVGERQRGLATGLNEFAGYVAVALAAFGSAWLAQRYDALGVIVVSGMVIAFIGLCCSIFWVRDTLKHVSLEAKESCRKKLVNIFADTTWRHKNLSSITQAGLVNNLNDGMMWGLLPLVMAQQGFQLTSIGFVAGLYPLVWGVTQVFTGKLSDIISKKELLLLGMLLQAVAITGFIWSGNLAYYAVCSMLLGLGTAAVYPVFLSAVADNTHPEQRAESIGVFRLWRDLGYLFGAFLTGLLADWFGSPVAISTIAALTALSGLLIWWRMRDIPPCDAPLPISLVTFLKKNFVSHSGNQRFLSHSNN
jgi:MFS family permease